MHKDIQLNPTHETNNSISFFYLLIIRKTANLEIAIYRKPTTTDTKINFSSNQPMEHRIASYGHHITRMNALPLAPHRKQKEWFTIQQIAQINNFPQTLIQRLNHQIQHKHNGKNRTNSEKQE